MTEQTMAMTLTPLTETQPGMHVRVSEVNGGKELRARLCALGLTPGTPVEIVSVGSGPVIVKVLDSRLMLGRGMAEKVLVRGA